MTVKREGSQTQVDAPERDEENEPTSALKMIEDTREIDDTDNSMTSDNDLQMAPD